MKCMYCGADTPNENHVCSACEAAANTLAQENGEGFSFKKWYEENKEEVSKRRRDRYKNDPEYRERKKLEATRFYWLKQRRAKSIGMNQADYEELELKPDSTMPITVTNEHDIRFGMTFDVPVFYPRKVALVVRRSVQSLRLWYLNGLLTEHCSLRNARNYRVVTGDQMRVFAENRHWLSFAVQDFRQHPFFALVSERMEGLQPDGIEPMLDTLWRLDPTPCPFCGAQTSLQRKVDGKWKHVNCFACLDPLDVAGRETLKSFVATGTCPACSQLFDVDVEAAEGKPLLVACPHCGRRVTDYDIVELRR